MHTAIFVLIGPEKQLFVQNWLVKYKHVRYTCVGTHNYTTHAFSTMFVFPFNANIDSFLRDFFLNSTTGAPLTYILYYLCIHNAPEVTVEDEFSIAKHARDLSTDITISYATGSEPIILMQCY